MDLQQGVVLGVLTALTMAIVEVAKQIGLNSRYAPLLSVITGIALITLGTFSIGTDLIIPGLIIGLTASGLYSGTKTVVTGQ